MTIRLLSLDPREYEHPLDREALNTLESIPGVKALFRKIYREYLEKVMYINNQGSNVLITKDNYQRLYKLLINASRILDMKAVPPLYIS